MIGPVAAVVHESRVADSAFVTAKHAAAFRSYRRRLS